MENYQQRVPNPMIKNYFKLAVRALLKNKIYSLINIFGLAIGIAICLLIVLFIQSELGYDQYHERKDRIYRLAGDRIYPARVASRSLIPQSIGGAVQRDLPEIEESTRIFPFGENNNTTVKIGAKIFEEKKIVLADSNFFRVFTGRFLEGDAQTALGIPGTVVLSENTAIKFFGSASAAMGQSIRFNDSTYRVNAVCREWPEKSHFRFTVLISDVGNPFTSQKELTTFAAHTYLLLRPGTSPEALEAKLPAVIERNVAPVIEQEFGMSYKNFRAAGNGYRYFLQPLEKIHLYSNLEYEIRPGGSVKELWLFSLIALFILGIAGINFINLSTARSMERAREVGIRKTFGSLRWQLIGQFLLESVLMSCLGMLLALVLVILLLPFFNQIAGKSLSALYFVGPFPALCLLLFSLLTGVTAGLYPAFVLSSFRPALVLKGKFTCNRYGLILRNGLVVFQFALSIILIISTFIVNRQMQYMTGSQLGFKKDHILVVQNAFNLRDHTEAFKDELSGVAGVGKVSGCFNLPGGEFLSTTFQVVGSKESHTESADVVDGQFAALLGLQLKQGRFFSNAFGTDTFAVVLNESAVASMQLKDPVGTRMNILAEWLNAPDPKSPKVFHVVGVVRDFYFQSLRKKISPLVLINTGGRFNTGLIGIQVNGAALAGVIDATQKLWKKMAPDQGFHFTFLDQDLADQYQSEQTVRKVFTGFSILAIGIACIGLLGLAAYMTRQRTLEIGIRKVLGASVQDILVLLSRDFLRLVIVSALIAFPLAWLAMHAWLQDYAYRVDLSWWIFLSGGVVALGIALFTISFQAIRAGIANPIDCLRTD
jgi:putative ABC transport system permease protein